MGYAPGPQRVAPFLGGVMSNLATWFNPSLQVMQRAKGRSAVAAAAYRSCTFLHDERVDIQHDYRKKGGHVSTELFGVEGLKLGMEDIGTLWNAAEKAENRKNSAVARELMVPLPHEWTDEQRRLCVRGLSEMLVSRYGVAVMASIHRPSEGDNDHVHIMFTTREVDSQMNFGKKTRILDDMKTGEVSKLREEICRVVNEHAKANGSDWYVYAGKFSDVDASHIPTKHIPINSTQEFRELMEVENKEIVEARTELKRIMTESQEVTSQLNLALEAIATEAKKEPIAPIIEPVGPSTEVINGVPEWVATSSPFSEPTPPKPTPKKIQDVKTDASPSPLSISLDYRHAYQEVRKAYTKRKEVRDIARAWIKELKELEDDPPSPGARIFAKVMKGLGLRDTVSIYDEKIAKAYEQLAKCKKHDERLTGIINDPERKRKYIEWQQWPEHRIRVADYEATLPDAPRRNPNLLANSRNNQSPTSPQPEPFNSEPWNNVANKQQIDYSDSPYYIADEPK